MARKNTFPSVVDRVFSAVGILAAGYLLHKDNWDSAIVCLLLAIIWAIWEVSDKE